MLNKLKKLRIQAMKDKDTVARYAYEAIIGEVQTLIGRKQNMTDERIFKVIKKEINNYKEMEGREAEIELLSTLLPEELPQLPEKEIKELLGERFIKQPKPAMNFLDSEGYKNRYSKAFVAKHVLSQTKGED